MTALQSAPDLHPLQPVADCLEAVAGALDRVPCGPIPDSDAESLEIVITESARLERRLRELRLRLARAAELSRAAESDASSGTDAWLARLTGSFAAVMRGGLWLARMLEERYPAVRDAFAQGGLGEEQARIIVSTAEAMPAVVSAAYADQHEAALLEREESLAQRELRRPELDREHGAGVHRAL